MTDDIVTRLRKHVRGDYEKTAEYLLGLAADEIERLRIATICLASWLENEGVSSADEALRYATESAEIYLLTNKGDINE